MTSPGGKRFYFTGHAIGAGAQFHRLDGHTGLDINVPIVGSSVLPVTGGLAQSEASDFHYSVSHPVRRKLLAVRHVETRAHGHVNGSIFQTDVSTKVEHSTWVERVHFDLLSFEMKTTHNGLAAVPTILLREVQIKGVHLGNVTAHFEIDEEPFSTHGTKAAVARFWASKSAKYRAQNASRFQTVRGNPTKLKQRRGYYDCSVVKNITLKGPAKDVAQMKVVGNTIIWHDPKRPKIGFGKIILGEVIIGGSDRRVTLARLEMGSPTGGSGSGGEGQSNGGT